MPEVIVIHSSDSSTDDEGVSASTVGGGRNVAGCRGFSGVSKNEEYESSPSSDEDGELWKKVPFAQRHGGGNDGGRGDNTSQHGTDPGRVHGGGSNIGRDGGSNVEHGGSNVRHGGGSRSNRGRGQGNNRHGGRTNGSASKGGRGGTTAGSGRGGSRRAGGRGGASTPQWFPSHTTLLPYQIIDNSKKAHESRGLPFNPSAVAARARGCEVGVSVLYTSYRRCWFYYIGSLSNLLICLLIVSGR